MKNAKVLACITALALILTTGVSTGTADASVPQRQQQINSLDFSETVSPNDISILSDAMLSELNKEDGEIVSIQEVERNLDTGNPDIMVPMTMPTSDFKMTVVAQRISEKGSGYDNFRFVAEGDWIETPFFEFTDKIALSWSDDFTLYSDSAYVYNGIVSNYNNTLRSTVDPEKGVSYDVNLRLGNNDDSVFLIAKVFKPNETGTANVVAEYGHVEIAARDITVGFSGGKSSAEISMSVGFGANLEKASPGYTSFSY